MEEIKIELKHILILFFVFLSILYVFAIKDYFISRQDRMSKVEKYLYKEDLSIGAVKISENYTLRQARRDYSYFVRFGAFNTTVNTILDDICS